MFKCRVPPFSPTPMALGCLLAMLSGSGSVAAEAGGPIDLFTLCLASLPEARPDRIWAAWSFAPAIVIPLALATGLYAHGLAAAGTASGTDRPPLARAALFAAGIGCLVVALMSPLCRMASTLAWAHMVQHVLLVVGAPLFLALSHPGRTLLAGLPRGLHARVAALGSAAAGPQPHAYLVVGFLLYGFNIWFWHVPALYEAALLSTGMHLVMYASLLAVSLMFWHAILESRRMPGAAGFAAVLLFFTFLHTGGLGILLTLSPRPWYPLMAMRGAAWGILPLDDQRLAGLIMWVPMGGIYVVVALALVARLIRTSGQIPVERQFRAKGP
ncbi:cytochrome c oxidase assembly protein [Microvirga calopogonii]|uniref:cytochrome c oxidase assembly protein n=1 Tax=Microvirga calopogonii TaxID=2078013 RepID=UPI0013B3AC68|nr:cytochrome c oxidase assembly protein [Microvirga calopogonii]